MSLLSFQSCRVCVAFVDVTADIVYKVSVCVQVGFVLSLWYDEYVAKL